MLPTMNFTGTLTSTPIHGPVSSQFLPPTTQEDKFSDAIVFIESKQITELTNQNFDNSLRARYIHLYVCLHISLCPPVRAMKAVQFDHLAKPCLWVLVQALDRESQTIFSGLDQHQDEQILVPHLYVSSI